MKIAVAKSEAGVGSFEQSNLFFILDTGNEVGSGTGVATSFDTLEKPAQGIVEERMVELLSEAGVEMLVVTSVSPSVLEVLERVGIEVHGAEEGVTVWQALVGFFNSTLRRLDESSDLVAE